MQLQIIVFGRLTDILGNTTLTLSSSTDTNGLVNELHNRYPALAATKYMMAVDKQTVSGNTVLKEGSTVALLPPFSGG